MTAGRRAVAWWKADGSSIGQAALAIQLSRQAPGTVRPPDLLALEDPASLRDFHEWSMAQGILGLVLNALRKSNQLAALRPDTVKRILAPLRILRSQAMLWGLERNRVVALLRDARVDPLVLKGAALCDMVYDDPSDRPLGDLDLLVDPSEMDSALKALEAGGYSLPSDPAEIERFRQSHFHLPLVNPSGFEVELHWGLGQPSLAWHLDSPGFLSRSMSFQTGATTLRVPAPEDMLLHLCTQNIEDSFSKLRRLVDIDRIAGRKSIDWDAFVARALAGRMEVIAGLSLHLANRLLGAGLPKEVITALLSSQAARFHLAALRPDYGMVTGRGPDMAVYTKALSIWLASSGRRVLHLRNILTWTDQWPSGDTKASLTSAAGHAIALVSFHLVLWARGLLGRLHPAFREAGPRFWDSGGLAKHT